MRKFNYYIKMALQPNVKNIISVLSLALGLALSLVLFGNVMYERSYDSFHENTDRLYIVNSHYNMENDGYDYDNRVSEVVLPALMAEMPEIERGTRFYHSSGMYKLDDKRFDLNGLVVDTSFFDVFSFEVIKGNPREDFKDPRAIYLSESRASDIFGTSDPIGKSLVKDSVVYTVMGVYKNIPNNSFVPKASFIGSIGQNRGGSWYGGNYNYAVLLLRDGASEEQAESKIAQIVNTKYDQVKAAAENKMIKYKLSLVKDDHRTNYGTNIMILITSFMALLLIIVTALNYSLISVSSLASRLKEFAVHKYSGASRAKIVLMIFIQTAIQTLFALGLAAILIVAFSGQIEQFLAPLESVFAINNLIYSLYVVIFLIIVSAIIPSRIFANISVMSLFRTSRNSHQVWKKIMLFCQFFFTITLVILAIMGYKQYGQMLNKDIGYDYDKLIHTSIDIDQKSDISMIEGELMSLNFVEGVTFSDFFLMYGLSGLSVEEDGARLFSARAIYTAEDYFDVHNMEIIDGESYRDGGSFYDVVINKRFIDYIKWDGDESAVGKTFMADGRNYNVIGVVKNFQCAWSDLTHANYMPLVMSPYNSSTRTTYKESIYITLKLNELSHQNIDAVRKVMKELNNGVNVRVTTYRNQRLYMFEDVKKPMDGLGLSGIIIFLISIIGLYGYIGNELQYKHREIALRKVYGASVILVIKMIYRPIFILLCIAIPLGVVAGYFGGDMMLGSTLPYVISMPWWIFVSVPIVILIFTYGIVAARTFKIASENPVKAIHE